MGCEVVGGISLQKEITVAHSPDPDDAFIFYAIANNEIDTDGLKIRQELADIETLNQKALSGIFDVTVISFHAYAYAYKNYVLLPCGASIGNKYGPIVVSQEFSHERELDGKIVAIPGRLTTATLALRLFQPSVILKVYPFDSIIPAIQKGEVLAGVLIHEGQVNYTDFGLHKLVDLGQWWWSQTKTVLPLAGVAVKKSLGIDMAKKISNLLTESIHFAFANRDKVIKYAEKFARGLDKTRLENFINMYVTNDTIEYDKKAKDSIRLMLERGFSAGIIKEKITPEFIS
jgi:1,4-dihydroxy-6-naphthoate synthase